MPMTLWQLEGFTAVANEGSVTGAADKLHVSQPSISRHLRSLNKEFGQDLYRIAGKRIELTSTGRRFFHRASRIVERLREAQSTIRETFAELPPSSLNVGASYTAAIT